jgi:integrase
MAQLKIEKIPAQNCVTRQEFVESVFLPRAEVRSRPSTVKGYKSMWRLHVKPRCVGLWLKDIDICVVQRWLDAIAVDTIPALSQNSLKRIQSFLSGVFKLARKLKYYTDQNPVHGTDLDPRAAGPAETFAYSLEQEQQILALLPEPAATSFAVACFSGLRLGEVEGLRWEDYRNGELQVSRSIWNGSVGKPKTRKSAAPVPVIKPLAQRLEMHRARSGNPQTGPMFPNSTGNPMSLNNVMHRHILPVLNRCEVCGLSKGRPHLKAKDAHDWIRDPRLPEWRGWHAARRGLGTNLYRLGVPPMVIQKILRHSDVNTTQSFYIIPTSADVRDGMAKFDQAVTETAAQGIFRTVSDSKNASGSPPELTN